MQHNDETGNPCAFGEACRRHFPHPEDWIDCEPREVNYEKLRRELIALGISGVRDYSVVGMSETGAFTGCYSWDASAPEGIYQHITLSDEDKARVRAAIVAHVV